MLEISVVPKHGAGGHGRFYPHSGYFGLSPVVVSGTLIARLPALCQPLPVRQVLVTVRCTEKRTLAGHSETQAVVWEKTKRIWEPSGEEEYGSLGDWEGAFKLAIPPDVARIAPSMQCTRDTKVTWHLEATIEHKPIPYVGSRLVATHLLHLRSYLAPTPHSSTPLTPPAPFSVPGAQVYVHAPAGAYGPGDTFTVSFHVRPDDPDVVVRKGSALLERRSEALGVPRPSPGLLEPREHQQRESRGFFRRSRSRSRSSSPGASSGPYQRLGDEDESAGGSMVRSTVLEAAAGDPVPGSGGGWWFTASGLVPVRSHKWDAGETGRTPLAATSFGVRVRFVLKSKGAHGREVTCSAVPIVLVAASAAERAEAQAAVAAADEKARGGLPGTHLPKKRHRSSRRGLYMHEGTVEISDPILVAEREREREAEREIRRRKTPETSSPTPELEMPDSGEAALAAAPTLVVPGVKPILLRDSSEGPTQTQTQSISFATPAHPGRSRSQTRSARADSATSGSTSTTLDSDSGAAAGSATEALSPSRRPASMIASTSTSMSISQLIHPDMSPFSPTMPQGERERGASYASWRNYGLGVAAHCERDPSVDSSLQRQFQHSGRRISATTSEEDEVQPSRSRPRLGDKARGHPHAHDHSHGHGHGQGQGHVRAHTSIPFIRTSSSSSSSSGSGVFGLGPGPGPSAQPADRPRPSLPSLNVLGLGLPHVPEYDRTPRPRTAPSHSVYPSGGGASRPSSSGASTGFGAAGSGSMGPPPLAAALSRPATASSVWERPVEGVFASTLQAARVSGQGTAPRAPPAPTRAQAHAQAPRETEPRGTTAVVVPVRDEEEGYRVGAGAFRRVSAGNVLGSGKGQMGPGTAQTPSQASRGVRAARGASGQAQQGQQGQQGQITGEEARFAFGLRG